MGYITCKRCERMLDENSFQKKDATGRRSRVCRECENKREKQKRHRDNSVGGNWLIAGCIHMPFNHVDMIDWFRDLNRTYKFTKIIILGDLYDHQGMSRFSKNPNLPSPLDEYKATIPIREKLYDLFPEVEFIWGNHDLRVLARAAEAYIPEYVIKGLPEIYGLPKGWNVHGTKMLLTHPHLGEILFLHGDKINKDAITNAKNLGRNFVMADRHTMSKTEWVRNILDEIYFGINTGCVVDINHPAFGYADGRLKRPVISVGAIIDGNPQNIIMPIDKDGRWLER